MNRKRIFIVLILTSFLIPVSVCGQRGYLTPGIKLRLENGSSQTLRSVHVYVTGQSHIVGDMIPSEIASLRLRPVGESDIEIRYLDNLGRVIIRCDIDYIETDYRGCLDLRLTSDGVLRLRSTILPL